jgi:hypothetical protein
MMMNVMGSMPACELCARHGANIRRVLQVLGKKHNEMGAGDKVAPAQFVAAWKALGVKVQQHMATAIFSKHGHDAAGRMPVQVRSCRSTVCFSRATSTASGYCCCSSAACSLYWCPPCAARSCWRQPASQAAR